jgi:hypothetical protein
MDINMDHDVLNELKEHMRSDIQLHGKLNEDITEIKTTLARMDVTLEKNTESLIEHVARTKLLEERVRPIEVHVAGVHGVMKFIGIVATLLGIAAGIIALLKP